jgi:hypothetical protein
VTDHAATAQTAQAERDFALRDLRTANRLIATMLERFTEHSPGVAADARYTRTEWVEDHVVAEWRAIAKAVQDGTL